MVVVDLRVAPAGDGEIQSAVHGEEREHMVEEADARGDLRNAFAVEIQTERNVGLRGGSLDRCSSHIMILLLEKWHLQIKLGIRNEE